MCCSLLFEAFTLHHAESFRRPTLSRITQTDDSSMSQQGIRSHRSAIRLDHGSATEDTIDHVLEYECVCISHRREIDQREIEEESNR